MARVRPSILIQDIRGKAGGSVFQMSPEGLIVRPRVDGTNPRTPAQLAVRSYFTRASQAFEGLTPVQYAAWKQYAAQNVRRDPITGKSRHQTPIAAFVELAAKFLQANPAGTIPLTPPTTQFNGDTITLTAAADTGKMTFTASAANAAGVTTEIMLQPLKTANRKPQSNAYRSKAFNAFASGSLSFQVTVPAGYYAAAYRFVKLSTGQASEAVYLPVTGVAFSLTGKKAA